jgi:uncharacterized Zn finger protein (UPF0148 family)
MSESKEIGELMLQGWTMSATTCDICYSLPLMLRKQTGESICVRCSKNSWTPSQTNNETGKQFTSSRGNDVSALKTRMEANLTERLAEICESIRFCGKEELLELIEIGERLARMLQVIGKAGPSSL